MFDTSVLYQNLMDFFNPVNLLQNMYKLLNLYRSLPGWLQLFLFFFFFGFFMSCLSLFILIIEYFCLFLKYFIRYFFLNPLLFLCGRIFKYFNLLIPSKKTVSQAAKDKELFALRMQLARMKKQEGKKK